MCIHIYAGPESVLHKNRKCVHIYMQGLKVYYIRRAPQSERVCINCVYVVDNKNSQTRTNGV